MSEQNILAVVRLVIKDKNNNITKYIEYRNKFDDIVISFLEKSKFVTYIKFKFALNYYPTLCEY